MRFAARLLPSVLSCLVVTLPAFAQAPVTYRVSFPAPEHHYAQIEVTFPNLPAGTLEARMSRSSPGRYALHEYAKNVFELQAFDGKGKVLPATRPNPYQWDIAGHDGTVRIVYKIYGDHVDGTYLGIDPSHAHMNMPATLMWARGLDQRAVRITFDPPKNLGWVVASQLFPTADAWTFTAPNLQYLMDSPTELSAQTIRTFKVRGADGKEATIKAAIHHDAGDAEVNAYVAGAEKIVREHGAVYGEFPEFEPGYYTFLGDYVPWGGGDGMEHRNSTVVAAPVSLRTPGMVADVLDTVSHEFFHAWNVERIRPKTLEPFNFEEANISGELWLAEGFTQYYGTLVMGRTGLSTRDDTAAGLARAAIAVINNPGRQFRSAVQMSQMAPFTDAARSVDRTNFSTTFISYYTVRLRRGARARLEPARSIERENLPGRLHAGDVAGPRQTRRAAAGAGGQALYPRGCSRPARRSVRRSRVCRRVLRQVHRRAGGRRLRASVAARRIRLAQAQREWSLDWTGESRRRQRDDQQPDAMGIAGLRRRSRSG